MHMCWEAHVYTHAYIHKIASAHVLNAWYTHTHTHTHADTHTHTHTYVHIINSCIWMAHTYTHIYIYKQERMHMGWMAHVYTHINIHMYKCSDSFMCYSTPSCVWHDPCMCAKQLMHMRGMAHMYTHIYTHMYILILTHIYILYSHAYTHILHADICTHIYTHIYTHTCIYIYTYIATHSGATVLLHVCENNIHTYNEFSYTLIYKLMRYSTPWCVRKWLMHVCDITHAYFWNYSFSDCRPCTDTVL